MNYVVESYENYKEENRLTTNNARKIEFITTTRVLDEVIGAKSNILDCAAGTGVYAFWLADKGHDVTATDITPRHIDVINQTLTTKEYSMNTAVLDATDMSCFADDTFDVETGKKIAFKRAYKKYVMAKKKAIAAFLAENNKLVDEFNDTVKNLMDSYDRADAHRTEEIKALITE